MWNDNDEYKYFHHLIQRFDKWKIEWFHSDAVPSVHTQKQLKAQVVF